MSTADRWRQVEQLCQAALDRSVGERESFLSSACGGDTALRQEVESLLAKESRADGFLSEPAIAAVAQRTGDLVGSSVVPIDPNTRPDNGLERYRLGREVARGGMGSIHVAQDLRLSRTVAIKQLLVPGADAKARFEREALITANLQHPAVVPVFDVGELPTHGPYYAMKLVEGVSLDRAIETTRTVDARLSLLSHVVTVVDAIAYAHSRGIVHRDLKPNNVLVGAFGETVVIDWGLAKELTASDDTLPVDVVPQSKGITHVGTIMGTPAYMPPEQAAGAIVDARADVYALGAMLYHLLAGRSPYPGTTAARVLAEVLDHAPGSLLRLEPSLPIDLVTIVERAMARAPLERYPTALEMAADLRRFQTGQLVGAHHYTAWQLLRRLVGKNPVAIGLGTLVTIAVLFALAVLLAQQLHVRRARETKRVTDAEIAAIETAMEEARDPTNLQRLEQRLEDAVRRARAAAGELAGPDAQVMLGNDQLDRRIHAVLARLDADTYSIPPEFRSVVARDLHRADGNSDMMKALDRIRRDKRRLWPIIRDALDAFGLPETLGYVAWIESAMNPIAQGPLGSTGLWQFRADTARKYGLRVDSTVDDRLDPVKSSRAAAHLLADGFAEFGGDATLIAVVSYFLGENPTRRLLQGIAMEKGSWRSGRRSYWHLYRMRRFTPEARAYVPGFVAAALLDDVTP